MKKINALWEQNHLGVKALEITVDETDDFLKVQNDTELHLYDYIVCKVSNQNTDFIYKIQEMDFAFIETQISLVINPLVANVEKFRKMSNNFNFVRVENNDNLSDLVDKISDDMFSTDRIALDHRFGISIANKRYKNWILSDFYKNDVEIFKINKKDKNIGFVMINTSNKKEINIMLGGIYSEFQGLGYGWNIVYQPIEYYSKFNANALKTKVSSNNLEVLKLYIAMGYQVEGLDYIFIKHKEEKNEK